MKDIIKKLLIKIETDLEYYREEWEIRELDELELEVLIERIKEYNTLKELEMKYK